MSRPSTWWAAAVRFVTTPASRADERRLVEELGEGHLRVRTYERGVENETLACGTGVTAAAIVTSYVRQPAVHRFRIEVPGGELEVRFRHEAGTQHYTDIRLTGPARRVFEGEFDTENF